MSDHEEVEDLYDIAEELNIAPAPEPHKAYYVEVQGPDGPPEYVELPDPTWHRGALFARYLTPKGKERFKPTELTPRLLPPLHFESWRTDYRQCRTEEAFINYACNNNVVIGQSTLGKLVHFPCHTITTGLFQSTQAGWQERPYLLILPAPAVTDLGGQAELSIYDPASNFVREQLAIAQIPLEECVFTYAARFGLPTGTKTYTTGQKATCAIYCRADARACKPKVIITFGSDGLKALLGADAKLGTVRGNVEDFEGTPIIPTQTPKEYMSGWGGIEVFQAELRRATEIRYGTYDAPKVDTSGYRVVRTVEDMRDLVATIRAAGPRHVAFDYEFGSSTKRDEHRVARSCQVSWGKGLAAFVMLRKPLDLADRRPVASQPYYLGLLGPEPETPRQAYWACEPAHPPEAYDEIVRLLGEIMAGPWRLDGHHLRTDINENWRLGIECDEKLGTGFCTMLAYHLLHGDDDIGLDQVCRRYTPQFGAYWSKLEKWLDANGRSRQLQFGYLTVPDSILIPYGLADADVAWQCAEILEVELRASPELWELFWNLSMPTALHIMDLERQGIQVDEVKRMEIRGIVKPEYEKVVSEFREMAGWPSFTGTPAQLASFLYSGQKYKGAKPLPEGVNGLGFQPPFNTDKYPVQWQDIIDEGAQHLHSPSTKSVAIELLMQEHPDCEELHYLKFMSTLGKFLNTYLSEQLLDLETGMPADGRSFAANIGEDGRVRTNIAQTSETYRWRSSKPNLQCNPKKQQEALLEAFVYRRFGGMKLSEYNARIDDRKPHAIPIVPSMRVVLPEFKEVYVAPVGRCFMEVDFQTAEVCVWAYCSGDQTLIKMIKQGRDIHCETATACFDLPIAAELAEALKELEAGDAKRYKAWGVNCKAVYSALRTVAKCIIFGIMYGRGANALSREINKQGVETSPEQCQLVIDGIAKKYAAGWAWLMARQQESIEEGYVRNAFGFKRYFSGASKLERKVQSKIKRQAGNAAIQSVVACLLCRAGTNFYRISRTPVGKAMGFKMVLPIHDAYLIELPIDKFESVKNVVRVSMSLQNKIPGTNYNLGVDFPKEPMLTAADH